MGRAWGYWTRGKLDVLRSYLEAFTTASKSVTERIYIDAFAGEVENRDRLTGQAIDGSARIALEVDDPPFTKLRFFEQPANAVALEETLRRDFPGRNLEVIGGDCNQELPRVLDSLRPWNWAPTFAFLDPNGTETKWSTLEALAAFRHGAHKTELFLLFAAPMFARLLPVDGRQVRPRDADVIDEMYGSREWREIYAARLDRRFEPGEAIEEYINLMRYRLETVLGYGWTHPLAVRNEQGAPIYHMIFATDHDAGTRIMSSLYAKAASEFPAMREEARRMRKQRADAERGVTSLFGEDDAALWAPPTKGERFYEHEKPWPPWFISN